MQLTSLLIELNPFLSIAIIVSIVILIITFINKGIEITSDNKTLRFFSRKKTKTLEIALMMEKIIELAYEISYKKKEKKVKYQMSYTEQMFEEIINIYIKNFRSDLEDLLKEREEKIINLEGHPDLQMFKACQETISHRWKNYSRSFFNDLFENLDLNPDLKIEEEKTQFVFFMNKEKEDVLNEIYKDEVGYYKRIISHTDACYIMKRDEIQIDHILKEIINHAKSTHEKVKLEECNKRKELENFLRENVL